MTTRQEPPGTMQVWIDQDLCTGDAQCAEICPDVFFMHGDGSSYKSYVRHAGDSGYGPDGEPKLQMRAGAADVTQSLEDSVVEAAEYCPGECIFIASDEQRAGTDPDASAAPTETA